MHQFACNLHIPLLMSKGNEISCPCFFFPFFPLFLFNLQATYYLSSLPHSFSSPKPNRHMEYEAQGGWQLLRDLPSAQNSKSWFPGDSLSSGKEAGLKRSYAPPLSSPNGDDHQKVREGRNRDIQLCPGPHICMPQTHPTLEGPGRAYEGGVRRERSLFFCDLSTCPVTLGKSHPLCGPGFLGLGSS